MNQSLLLILMMMVVVSALVLITRYMHLLTALLALEALMLSTVVLVPLLVTQHSGMVNPLSIILLTFGACEASLGLSLMVIMSRSYGSDMMNILTINKC